MTPNEYQQAVSRDVARATFVLAAGLAVVSLAVEWEHHWQIGGWAGVVWFASVCGRAALPGAVLGWWSRG